MHSFMQPSGSVGSSVRSSQSCSSAERVGKVFSRRPRTSHTACGSGKARILSNTEMSIGCLNCPRRQDASIFACSLQALPAPPSGQAERDGKGHAAGGRTRSLDKNQPHRLWERQDKGLEQCNDVDRLPQLPRATRCLHSRGLRALPAPPVKCRAVGKRPRSRRPHTLAGQDLATPLAGAARQGS